ncbi:uncharacterized protein [Typha latifolia]|uniref:uncharacterized protein n=1 Tax=Typha latifolia TaxID=4733 RepID=UPI003C2FF9BA
MKGGRNVTLEDYAFFLRNPNRHHLTVDQLNQIVFMHGLIKLHRHHKTVIVDSLFSLDLMPPTQSTIRAGASPAALLSLEEVKQDIEALGWQECPVGSILTVGSGEWAVALARVSPSTRLSSSTPGGGAPKKAGKKRKLVSTLLSFPSIESN